MVLYGMRTNVCLSVLLGFEGKPPEPETNKWDALRIEIDPQW